jgi:hypothetical protein
MKCGDHWHIGHSRRNNGKRAVEACYNDNVETNKVYEVKDSIRKDRKRAKALKKRAKA